MPAYGNTKPVPGETPLERLNRLTCRCGGPDACWPFLGALQLAGMPYGRFKLNGSTVPAHRASWILSIGDPGPLCVCHECDYPPCVNPSHLFLGTHKDNIKDKYAKGRGLFGEQLGNSRLTEAAVLDIYRRRHRVSAPALAAQHGVCASTIYNVIHRRTWGWLTREAA